MAREVREVMNHEVFSVRAEETASAVLASLRSMGVTAAPVTDADGRPVGFVAIRDLVDVDDDAPIGKVMSHPADVVAVEAELEAAADRMIAKNRHHLAVVEREGHLVGFLSAMDVLRGLRGAPARHPDAFPHVDAVTGLVWTDAVPFNEVAVAKAPAGPGVYRLIRTRPGERDVVVWSEASADVRARLLEILGTPRAAPPHLADAVAQRQLCVRTAAAPSSRELYERKHRR